MIQRIQTVFMFLASVAMFALLFVIIWGKVDAQSGEIAELTAFQLVYKQGQVIKYTANTIYLGALALLSSALSFGAIFSFKNLMRQVQLNIINLLVIIATIGIILYQVFFVGEKLFNPTQQGGYSIGFFLPLASVFFINLANRFIRKDYKLLKSVDRLR